MPPKQKIKKSITTDTFSSEHFLRSINIEFDAEYPERIEHFFPTTKSIRLLKAILGQEQERAFFIVAPYGSGKSLTATYALHLIENRSVSSEMLGTISSRLCKADKELGEFCAKRKRGKKNGLVIPLHGYCSNISESIKASTLQAMGRHKLGREAKSLESLPCSNIEEAIEFLNNALEKGKDVQEFTKALIHYLRQGLILKIWPELQNPIITGLTGEEQTKLKSQIAKFPEAELRRILKLFLEAENRMKYSSIPQLPLELAIIESTSEAQAERSAEMKA